MQKDACETDIEGAMRAGACDLVSLGLKSRLQSVVTRELRRTARRTRAELNAAIGDRVQASSQGPHGRIGEFLCTGPGRHLH